MVETSKRLAVNESLLNRLFDTPDELDRQSEAQRLKIQHERTELIVQMNLPMYHVEIVPVIEDLWEESDL
ncbi:hypothetical protein H0X10_03310 [Candidatus Saccharibacteria bacterium]|nr:hypothetical protein [Candidatus Saccharibacteria bacterium]